jgi:hypothetical protein
MSNSNTYHHLRKSVKHNLPVCTELVEKTANLWLSQGTLTITSTGAENTYYVNEFGMEFYCKNYPQ